MDFARTMRGLILGALLLAACVGTPQPDPPALAPFSPTLTPDIVLATPGVLVTVRGAGAEGFDEVWALNLDEDAQVERASVRDGTFTFVLTLSEGDRVRTWATYGGVRSLQRDFVLVGPTLQPWEDPVPCWSIPATTLATGVVAQSSTVELALTNTCDVPITPARVESRRLPLGDAATPDLSPLPPGATRIFVFYLTPLQSGVTVDGLIVEVDGISKVSTLFLEAP
jgi:hypothetical protein